MKYNIKDTSKTDKLQECCNIPFFAAKVLSSYNDDSIKDVLEYKKKDVVFDQMDQAMSLIKSHMEKKSKIVIMGDYDCDGILGTSIVVKAFGKLNYGVGYYIPNRIVDGYGLNIDIVNKFIAKEYDLIITVDNGINAKEAIDLALDNGLDVIVTDHHTQDEAMKSDVIYVHPAYSNLDYYVSGGFVAFYLSAALLEYEDDYFQALAAITLISDVMPLIKGNRLFLREALSNMNTKHYLQIDSLADGFIDSSMIGSIIAPKINSLGRLPDIYNPNNLVRYFCSNNRMNILNYAKEINECNNVRKQMTADYFQEYQQQEINNNLLMIEQDGLHEGLIGLLASRFTNQYNCISFVATKDNNQSKASVRSISQINVYDIFMKHQELFDKIGGHAQAMGLSYQADKFDEIKETISKELESIEIPDKVYDVIEIKESDITLDNIQSLRFLEPFGNSFEAPLFLLKNVLVASIKGLKGNLHHRLTLLSDNTTIEVMLFNSSDMNIKINDHIDIIVKLGINEYNGRVKPNAIVEDYQVL